ncbi:MAG: bidirectional hydrogenase complex protein HoxE [Chloroflexi bacterium]|nr:bidirectional hydrogenase complex protein HoxE [Chloroflexota bacterium]
MNVTTRKPTPPSDDKRWRIVEATMRRHGHESDALIEALHSTQEAFGFLDESSLRYVAAALGVPPSAAYGVATFYQHFAMRPPGEHTCVVCLGTVCHLKGGRALLAAVEHEARIEPGETTADGTLSMLTARCVGACAIAPVAVLDGDVVGKLTPEDVVERVRKWARHDPR